MSDYMYKHGVYWNLPMLNDKTCLELIEIFKLLGCNTYYYDESDEELDYKESNQTFHPRLTDNGWILEYIFTVDYFTEFVYFSIDIDTVNKLTNTIGYNLNMILSKLHPIVFSYVWYNGVDEPFPNEIKAFEIKM